MCAVRTLLRRLSERPECKFEIENFRYFWNLKKNESLINR